MFKDTPSLTLSSKLSNVFDVTADCMVGNNFRIFPRNLVIGYTRVLGQFRIFFSPEKMSHTQISLWRDRFPLRKFLASIWDLNLLYFFTADEILRWESEGYERMFFF